ncbi:hypothetical protein [Lunatibacter salilacus]|uniref:hypothetical protein n=1 Tax=Lunatibacter salilacus TaxID=2483804 RepID=UPI00131E606A|nr:hypothetical protein [Lunatibacter salilacus]
MKRLLSILWVFCIIGPGMGQGYIGPSPDAMGLFRQASVGVSHYTGSANIGIPLGEISGRELGVGLSLSYNSFGHRVQDVASSEGLGWSLQAGGMISRVVRGTPDDLTGGFCMNSATDKEPDLFIFSFMGRTGKFVVSQTKQVVLFPFQDLKVIPGMCGLGDTWEIIDENGTKYHFGTTVGSRERTSTWKGTLVQPEYTSTWYLTKIISANGTDEITLSYAAASPYSYVNYYFEKDDGYCSSPEKNESVTVTVRSSKLTEISSSGGKVLLTWNTQRKDLQGARSLATVSFVDNTGKAESKYYFEYGYFQGCQEADNLCKRLKLEKIYDISTTPLYEFQYNETVNLPSRISKNIDYLGLYNNNTVNSWIPAITDPSSYSGASRTPDTNRMKANLLTRINQRGGSHTLFTYEPHSGFYGSTFNAVLSGNRIKSISNYSDGNLLQTTNYKYVKENVPSESSGILFRKPVFRYYTNFPGLTVKRFSHTYLEMFDVNGTHVGYSSVEEEIVGKGFMVYTFTNYAEFPDEDFNGNPVNDQDPVVSPTSRFWERGNVKTITAKKLNNTDVIYKETYEYNHNIPDKAVVTATRPNPFKFSCFNQSLTSQYRIISKPFTVTKKITEVHDQDVSTRKITNIEEYAYNPITFQLIEKKAYNNAIPSEKYISRYKFVTHADYNVATSQSQACENTYYQCGQSCGVNNYSCWNTCQENFYTCMNTASSDERVVAIQALRNKHAQNVVVEEQSWLEKGGSQFFLGAGITLFKRTEPSSNKIVPASTWYSKKVTGTYSGSHISSTNFVLPASFVQSDVYNEYDLATAKLTKSTGGDGTVTQMTWTYNGILLAGTTLNPGQSQLTKSFEYRPLVGPVKETDTNGNFGLTEYDEFGRVRLAKDKNNNILMRNRYHYQNERAGMRIKSNRIDALTNQQIQFNLDDIVSPGGGTPEFAWDMDNGTVYDDSRLTTSLSYATPGSYNVKAVMFTNEFEPFTASKEVFVWQPLNFSLCIDGPQFIDLCYQDPVIFGTCTQQNNQPTSPIGIKVNFSSEGCPNVNTFLWEYKRPGESNWNVINSLGTTAVLPHQAFVPGYYEIRCTYTDGCNSTVVRTTYASFYKSNPLC